MQHASLIGVGACSGVSNLERQPSTHYGCTCASALDARTHLQSRLWEGVHGYTFMPTAPIEIRSPESPVFQLRVCAGTLQNSACAACGLAVPCCHVCLMYCSCAPAWPPPHTCIPAAGMSVTKVGRHCTKTNAATSQNKTGTTSAHTLLDLHHCACTVVHGRTHIHIHTATATPALWCTNACPPAPMLCTMSCPHM